MLRVYEDGVNHVHINFGLSLPSGNTTEEMTMLRPTDGANMVHRAMYGMQLGSGTVDLFPGITYNARQDVWSWGAAWAGASTDRKATVITGAISTS